MPRYHPPRITTGPWAFLMSEVPYPPPRQGTWAAACLLGRQECASSPFELFAHATHFLGHKVVLLGRFNAQGLPVNSKPQPLNTKP